MSMLGLAWWMACIALLLGSTLLALLQPMLARRGERSVDPGTAVSMLVPLRGNPPGFAEATRSAVAQTHAALEILFSAAQGDEAAASAIRVALAAAPSGRNLRLLRTTPSTGVNPKIGNLLEPYAAAAHDHILIKDATTVLAPDQVDAMLHCLGPRVGLVCAAPIGRAPAGLVAAVEAALINTYGARMLLAAASLGLGVGIGAVMLFRRSDLDRAGGLARIAPAIADDHALCKVLAERGLRTTFTAATVDQPLGLRDGSSLWRRHLRWALCRRTAEPLAFWLEPFSGLGAACLAAWLALASPPAVLATLLLWPLVECLLAGARRWPVGVLTPFAILLREALLPALWLGALLTRRISWGDASVPVTPLQGRS